MITEECRFVHHVRWHTAGIAVQVASKQKINGTLFSIGSYIGIPTGYIVFSDPRSFMNSIGASLFGQYSLTDKLTLSLRIGAGYPLFFTNGEWSYGGTRFLFGMWPDLGLELAFKL